MTYDSSDEPIVISKPTMDLLLSNQKLYSDLLGLYSFYYYTAKWQKTNQPRCNQSYVMKGLGWTEERVRRSKTVLRGMGLIEDVRTKDADTGKVVGAFIKINFIWTAKKVQEVTTPPDCQGGGYDQGVVDLGINALRGNKGNALIDSSKEKTYVDSDESTAVVDETTPPIPYEDIKDLWNKYAKVSGLPTINILTDSRKSKLKSRIKEIPTIKEWGLLLRKMREIPFLMGDSEGGWKIDFDFLIKNSTIPVKIMEGGWMKSTKQPAAKKPPHSHNDLPSSEKSLDRKTVKVVNSVQ